VAMKMIIVIWDR